MLTKEQYKNIKEGDELIATGYKEAFNSYDYVDAVVANDYKLPVKLINKYNIRNLTKPNHTVSIEFIDNDKIKSRQIVHVEHLIPLDKSPEEYDDSDIMEG